MPTQDPYSGQRGAARLARRIEQCRAWRRIKVWEKATSDAEDYSDDYLGVSQRHALAVYFDKLDRES